MTGAYGVPTSGVGAVALSLTVVIPSAQGYIDVTADPQPAGSDRVTALDWGANQTVCNSTIVSVGSDGKITVISQIAVTLVIDLQGYFTTTDTGPAPGGYVPVTPARVLSTQNRALASASATNVTVTGSTSGVPANASAVFLNVTVAHQSGAGWVAVYPAGTTRPTAADDYPDTDAKAFGVESGVAGSPGQVAIYNGGSSAIDIIVDVVGYFAAINSSGAFNPWQTRVYDTRDTGHSALASNAVGTYQIAGLNQIPTTGEGTSAVLVDILALEPSSGNNGYIRVWPSDQTEPTISTANLNPGDAVSTLAAVAVGADGAVKIRNTGSAAVDIVLDVQGWFNAATGLPQPSGPLCQFSGNRSGSKPITHSLTDREQMLVNPINGNLNLTGTLLHLTGVKQDVSISWRYNSLNDARPTLSVGRYEGSSILTGQGLGFGLGPRA